jgi:hypothetical protein
MAELNFAIHSFVSASLQPSRRTTVLISRRIHASYDREAYGNRPFPGTITPRIELELHPPKMAP